MCDARIQICIKRKTARNSLLPCSFIAVQMRELYHRGKSLLHPEKHTMNIAKVIFLDTRLDTFLPRASI